VNAKGQYGIAGHNGSKEKLLIRNATVTAEVEDLPKGIYIVNGKKFVKK